MAHTKKKAGILSVGTALIGAGMSSVSSGLYIEASVFFAMSTGCFLGYEKLNIKEVDFAVEDAERIAETVGSTVDDQINDD